MLIISLITLMQYAKHQQPREYVDLVEVKTQMLMVYFVNADKIKAELPNDRRKTLILRRKLLIIYPCKS